MKNLTKLQHALAAAALGLCSSAFAATEMSHADYSSQKDGIEAKYKADKEACSKMSGNAKDVCMEKAKGVESVAKAELEFRHTGKPADGAKVATAQADASYAVAKEMCDDKSGDAKNLCVTQAKSAHDKALADAKLDKKVEAAHASASDDKKAADRKVAEAKCDALSGSAKSTCMDAAKAQYSK